MAGRTPPTLLHRLAEAFNRRDLPALGVLLAPEATAQVLGAPFPVEEGPEAILRTSLAYLLDEAQGALEARVFCEGGSTCLLLVPAAHPDTLDTVVRVTAEGGAVLHLAYLTLPHRLEEVRAIARAAGLGVADAPGEGA